SVRWQKKRGFCRQRRPRRDRPLLVSTLQAEACATGQALIDNTNEKTPANLDPTKPYIGTQQGAQFGNRVYPRNPHQYRLDLSVVSGRRSGSGRTWSSARISW